MGKGIYTYYKERLIEIGGNNKCLCLRSIVKKNAYDIGRIFEGRDTKIADFLDFLHSDSHTPLTLVDKKERNDILTALDVEEKVEKKFKATENISDEELKKLKDKENKFRRDEYQRAIETELTRIKELKRETEEIEKETGRYELYIGYPFVFGTIVQSGTKTTVKAPLLLIPVSIEFPDEYTAEIYVSHKEKIRINPALVYAYAQSKKLNLEGIELEYDDLSEFKTVKDVVAYLAGFGVKIEYTNSKNIYAYQRFKEPDGKPYLSVRHGCVMGRFPLSNSIYADYSVLEKQKLTNDAINELLIPKKHKKKKKPRAKKKGAQTKESYYAVKMLDYAQSRVIEKVSENGNMVIYGPPGTGKSQTIVNIITDSIVKNKRVLVVSQKKAALDVVYNRLGALNEKAMYIADESREKSKFYDRCFTAHASSMSEALVNLDYAEKEYAELEKRIGNEINSLNRIYNVLNDKRQFGLSLAEMYEKSYNISKQSNDYRIYQELIENPDIMALDYKSLADALFVIRSQNLEKLYYSFVENKEKNPIIEHLRPDVDLGTISEVKELIAKTSRSRKGIFNTKKYPYYRQVLTYYYELENEKNIDRLVDIECRFAHPKMLFKGDKKKEIKEKLKDTIKALEEYIEMYRFLRRVLTDDGFLAVIDNIIRGNTQYIRHVNDALDDYISLRDVHKLLESLDKNNITVLNFAYINSKGYQNYLDIISKVLYLRIYHEIQVYEEKCKDDLALTVDFPNITSRIYKLRNEQLGVAAKICSGKTSREYDALYESREDNKDYLYQISKKKKQWPIRKTMEVYGQFILSLFPCWLLSPENVSTLLPLTKNLFDIVIFDEASQVFIESTIPTIYRGKNIVVAGDAKQLRPSTTFVKRYLGADPELLDDYSVQAALEVDSLLDLAVSRYESAWLTYHYRSQSQELIEFSNNAFYNSELQISPNVKRSENQTPIVRHRVNGKWINRENLVEADEVVKIIKDIFKTRKNGESIGIITFNSDQQDAIADAIDKEMANNADFRSDMIKERNRIENGEDISIFIKNLENVQGDERDIIIFSIGYAENEQGKVYTNFGSLSGEGGENRLNVAITRAKRKIHIVTSIEPEALKVDGAKNAGPKLLKQYLMFARAVSKEDCEEQRAILSSLNLDNSKAESVEVSTSIEDEIKERLEKLGYSVDTRLGNRKNRISLAVYDEKSGRYLVGVELDKDALRVSESVMERDVYRPKFFESRGWTILRVWCRDWWLYPGKVVKTIAQTADKNYFKIHGEKPVRKIKGKISERDNSELDFDTDEEN